MPLSTRIHAFIRQNVLGLVAIFIALGGTAYATHPNGTNTISTADLQNLAVTSAKIGPQAVSSGKIADDAVRTPKIRDLAITPEKLQSLAVKTSKIGGQAVTNGKIADGAVTSPKVLNNSLTGDDIKESTLDIGLGFYTGRLSDLPTDPDVSAKGAPSGVTATPDISEGLDSPYATLSPNRTTAIRDLSVTLTNPVVGDDPRVFGIAGFGGGNAPSLACLIFPGASSCTASGPSDVVAASSQLLFFSVGGSQAQTPGTAALFSWRATVPGPPPGPM